MISNRWKLALTALPIIGTLAIAQPQPGGLGGFFQAWWAATIPIPQDGLVLWLDASDQSTLITTNTSELVAWLDKSPQGRHATNKTASSTILTTNKQNNLTVATFNNARLLGVFDKSFSAQSVILVLKPTNSGSFLRMFSQSVSSVTADSQGTGHYIPILRSNVGGLFGSYANGGMRSTLSITTGVYSVFMSTHSGTNIINYSMNNAGTSYGHTIASLYFNYSLGSEPTTTAFHQNGDYAEVIVYDRLITEVEREKILSYLTAKWGL